MSSAELSCGSRVKPQHFVQAASEYHGDPPLMCFPGLNEFELCVAASLWMEDNALGEDMDLILGLSMAM